MDDFHVGSVPATDLFGSRRPSDPLTRRRQHRRDGESEEGDDNVEALEASDSQSDTSGESIEDYYLPSDPSGE